MKTLFVRFLLGDLDLTDYPFSVEFGSDLGSPENVVEALASLLPDGENEISVRAGNRTLVLPLLIEGSDQKALADAEAALTLECAKPRNALTLDPGDGFGAVTVFDTFAGQVTFDRQENLEMHGLRRYSLTVRALPYPRPDVETVAAALEDPEAPSPSPVTVMVDNTSSATGWTGFNVGGPATVTANSGTLNIVPVGFGPVTFDRTGAVDFTTTTFVSLSYLFSDMNAYITRAQLYIDTVEAPLVAQGPTPGFPGWVTATWKVPAAAATRVKPVFSWTTTGFGMDPIMRISGLVRSNMAPFSGTPRQKYRTIPVGGSAPTQGSLEITHPSASLGDVLAYTWVDDGSPYLPALRVHHVGGTPTPDASLVSGAYESIATPWEARVPVASVPAGVGVLMARLKSSAAGLVEVFWAASTYVGDTSVGVVQGSTMVNFPSTDWVIVPLARDQFRATSVKATSSAVVRFGIQRAAVSATVLIDDAWNFNLDADLGVTGALTHVQCGYSLPTVGGSSSRLSIETASTERPFPTIYRGTLADESDWFYAGDQAIKAQGIHQFKPPFVKLMTVTVNAYDASAALRHYPRFHTHVA